MVDHIRRIDRSFPIICVTRQRQAVLQENTVKELVERLEGVNVFVDLLYGVYALSSVVFIVK